MKVNADHQTVPVTSLSGKSWGKFASHTGRELASRTFVALWIRATRISELSNQIYLCLTIRSSVGP
jgi:hypothetical protein